MTVLKIPKLCLAVLDEYRANKVIEIAAAAPGPTIAERLAQFEQWAEHGVQALLRPV